MPNVLVNIGSEIWADFAKVRAGTHASSISFFFFISVIPLVILYASFYTSVGISEIDIVEFIRNVVPPDLENFVTTIVQEAYEKSKLALSLSILVLLWTGSLGASALRFGLNAAYGVAERRNRLVVAGISLLFVAIILVAMTGVMYLMFGAGLINAIAGIVADEAVKSTTATALQSVGMFVVGVLVFAACYTFLAAGKRKFAAQLPGALFAAIATFVFSFAYHLYIGHFNRFTLFYGSLATVALFLFWMYCVFYIVLLGAFVNRFFATPITQQLAAIERTLAPTDARQPMPAWRVVQADEASYGTARDFYHSLIDDMRAAGLEIAWKKDIYPSPEMLKTALAKGELYFGYLGDELAAAMILNHEHNEAYAIAHWPTPAPDAQTMVIHALGVHPRFGGQGLGTKMVDEAIERAKSSGHKVIRLDVLKGNEPARRIYVKRGFVYVGEVEMFYENTGLTSFELFEYVL